MTVRTIEEAEALPLRESFSVWAWMRAQGIRSGCTCCPYEVRKGKRSSGHGKHRTLRDYRKGR